jgi:hypothetical protein
MCKITSLSLRSASGLAGIALLSALFLAACGGGGGAVPSASSSFAMGRISGFGSIVVNGVHYDESSAAVEDEDGQSGSAGDLELGMVVEVDAGSIGQSGGVSTADATHVTTISLMKGPVESVGTDSLVVLGQTVKVTATTVFDDMLAGGLSKLAAGAVVKVYGTLDSATATYTASRIELKQSASFYTLRGVVANYDATAKTLTIGTTVIDVSTASLPTGLATGSMVRVKLLTTQANGRWVAESVKSGAMRPHDSDHAEVEGMITDFTSTASFSVDGLPVDAKDASFPDGTMGIAKGARVEVEGSIVNGVLVATKVELKTEQEDQANGFEVDGSVSAIDAVNSTITVRGVVVSYGPSTVFSGGVATDIVVGSRVEVHGTLASDGVTVNASTIHIKAKS